MNFWIIFAFENNIFSLNFIYKIIATALITLGMESIVFAQCAMCAASVESNDENLVGQGLNAGILFLMSAPYILVGTVAFIWYRNYKKSKE